MKVILRKLALFLGDSYFVARFVLGRCGREYGIGRLRKLRLAMRFIRNVKKLGALSNWRQHVILAEEIFSVPKSAPGDVVECGCFNGASTASLSLACALVNRRLFVCDSFEGLPKPRDDERHEIHDSAAEYYLWEKGEFASEHGLEGVKNNVARFGDIRPCRFVKGFFCDTLRDLESDSLVLVFEDADLRSSVEDCVEHLWPKLGYGCKFFCHEPWSIQVVSLFYDAQWWADRLGTPPPGFHGSGAGTIAGITYSTMGYAKKFDAEAVKRTGKKRVHSGSAGFAHTRREAIGDSRHAELRVLETRMDSRLILEAWGERGTDLDHHDDQHRSGR